MKMIGRNAVSRFNERIISKDLDDLGTEETRRSEGICSHYSADYHCEDLRRLTTVSFHEMHAR